MKLPMIVKFADGLYNTECADCGEGLDWEASFDADGTDYFANCCGYDYRMSPETVKIDREKEDE